MKVRDLMTKDVKYCRPEDNLAAATAIMWANDCGVMPVVKDGRVCGIITDRDICVALGTRNRRASEVPVGEVATRQVETCEPDADVHAAMAIMRRAKVRRLPVAQDGRLEGILTLNDLVLAADRKHAGVDYDEVMNTMKAICEHTAAKHAASAAAGQRPATPVAAA